ncbi:zinc ribbon domain-containing protein [Acidianus sulfidivorans]|uniref:zinc ribbon domain-containing protein n=1 Tax=Acidianus sulfidivorans TaxID=312539 RepID=UPI003B831057
MFVQAKYSSQTCPKCGSKMKESGYRTLKCEKCSFKENSDYVAVYNLYGDSLRLSNERCKHESMRERSCPLG